MTAFTLLAPDGCLRAFQCTAVVDGIPIDPAMPAELGPEWVGQTYVVTQDSGFNVRRIGSTGPGGSTWHGIYTHLPDAVAKAVEMKEGVPV